jgi:superfamily II DNA helicase RecQ
VEQAQRDEVFKHLENGTLKLLFVHPEMAHSVAHHQIKLLLMDEA